MASLLLAAFVAQTKGIKFYHLQTSGACRGERVSLVWRPDSVYDINCLDVRLARGRFLHGHIDAPIAARLFPLKLGSQYVASECDAVRLAARALLRAAPTSWPLVKNLKTLAKNQAAIPPCLSHGIRSTVVKIIED